MKRPNPLLLVAIAVVGLIIFVLMSRDRGDSMALVSPPKIIQSGQLESNNEVDESASPNSQETSQETSQQITLKITQEIAEEVAEEIGKDAKADLERMAEAESEAESEAPLTPGTRARSFIKQLRSEGQPYPLDVAYLRAQQFLEEGSLADAHLVYFFAAREGHISAIMKMAEMSDPVIFEAENSLLDQSDLTQAFKWYQKALALGHQSASQRVDNLQQWAQAQAETGNSDAEKFLLNFQ